IISDVVGDKLDSIASGPTVPDTSTFHDAVKILKRYNIYKKVPTSVANHLESGLRDNLLETPKVNDICFNNVYNYLVGSVKSAVEAVMSFLEFEGFKTIYFSDTIIGEAVNFGESLLNIIEQSIIEVSSSKLALIGSGELTVTIKGKGIGGRNQEMLLGFLDSIRNREISYEFVIIAANLDGIEGNSNAMGALIDNSVLDKIRKEGINTKDYLENNDSNSLFRVLETDIITNLTGCNVNDLLLILLRI
ncbi:MAG: MOFRL family protein, partial [Candidatus Thorarchaeota archaeon]